MLLDAKNGREFDLDLGGEAKTYIIASTPRTGSTLLCRALWSTQLAGAPKEYLNPMQVRDWNVRQRDWLRALPYRPLRGPLLGLLRFRPWTDERLRSQLEWIRTHRSGQHWLGLKIHWHHYQQIFRGRTIEDWLGEVVWIRISRRDRLRQSISWVRALQTNQWASSQRSLRTPRYSRRQIAHRLQLIEQHEHQWDKILAEQTALHLQYEDVANDLHGSVEQVLRTLNIPMPVFTLGQDEPMRRQSDEINDAWTRRYLDGH